MSIDYGRYVPWTLRDGREAMFRIIPATLIDNTEHGAESDDDLTVEEAQSPEEGLGWAIQLLAYDSPEKLDVHKVEIDIAYPENMRIFRYFNEAHEHIVTGCAESDAWRSQWGDNQDTYLPRIEEDVVYA